MKVGKGSKGVQDTSGVSPVGSKLPQIDFWPWASRNPCFSLNIPKKEFGALRWLPHPAPDTREADKFENKFSNIYVVELKNVFHLALDTYLVAHEYMSLILEYCLLFMKNLCVKHWLGARLKKCSGQNLAKLFSKYRRQLCAKHLHLSDWDFNQWAKSGCKRYNFF